MRSTPRLILIFKIDSFNWTRTSHRTTMGLDSKMSRRCPAEGDSYVPRI